MVHGDAKRCVQCTSIGEKVGREEGRESGRERERMSQDRKQQVL